MISGPSIGDLAQTFMLRRQNVELQKQNQRLLEELASGRAADTVRHLSGDFSHLAEIEHDLVVLESYRFSANDARTVATTMQTALERVQDLGAELSESAIAGATLDGRVQISALSEQARQSLDVMVSALNTESAWRGLFSGSKSDGSAIIPAQDVIAASRAALGGAATAADIMAGLDSFFQASGGAFETDVYMGATEAPTPFQLGEDEKVQLDLRADNPAIRETLKFTVAMALATDPALGLTGEEAHMLLRQAGSGLFDAQSELTEVRAHLGYVEQRIDQAITRVSSELSTLEQARGDLLSVDPFQTATDLETTQSQIEMLYTLTARSARLSLVSFLT